MARAMGVTVAGGESDSVRVEYVKTHRLLRVWTVSDKGGARRRFELPLDALARTLDVELLPSQAPARFLLFGGSSSEPRRGSAGLLAAFASEQDARTAFHELRESPAGRSGWAELVVLRDRRQPRRLCWFERGGSPAAGVQALADTSLQPPRLRTWLKITPRRRRPRRPLDHW